MSYAGIFRGGGGLVDVIFERMQRYKDPSVVGVFFRGIAVLIVFFREFWFIFILLLAVKLVGWSQRLARLSLFGLLGVLNGFLILLYRYTMLLGSFTVFGPLSLLEPLKCLDRFSQNIC